MTITSLYKERQQERGAIYLAIKKKQSSTKENTKLATVGI